MPAIGFLRVCLQLKELYNYYSFNYFKQQMYLPFNGISQSHQFLLTPQTLSRLPDYNSHFQMTETVQVYNKSCCSLQLQITQLKSIMLQMQGQIAELKSQLLSQRQKQRNESINDLQCEEPSKKVKLYTKDKKCWIEGCHKKYSSKIALNAHLRKVHRIFKTPRAKPL